nr:metalloregulator ArsR/SmtB family transcription factor [uncultured Cohaesibacter sp.]
MAKFALDLIFEYTKLAKSNDNVGQIETCPKCPPNSKGNPDLADGTTGAGMAEESSIEALADQADEVARLLKLLGNGNRLRILCQLTDGKDKSVNCLAEHLNISQSALSQHLAKMREDGLIAGRRDAQTIYYSIADGNAELLLSVLKDLYCSNDDSQGAPAVTK